MGGKQKRLYNNKTYQRIPYGGDVMWDIGIELIEPNYKPQVHNYISTCRLLTQFRSVA